MLVLSLLMMGVATLLIGLLPTYEAIGVAAPVLLVVLRFVQGLGVGGEWGGAVLMAVEHAPRRRRAFYGSFPQLGVPLGVALATATFLVLAVTLGTERVAAGGWRIAFLASAVLVVVGLIVRLKVDESPAFVAARSRGDISRAPLVEVLRLYPRNVAAAALASISAVGFGQVILTFGLSYATTELGVPQATFLLLQIASCLIWAAVIVVAAILADRIGRKPVFVLGALLTCAWSFPLFALMNQRSLGWVLAALVGAFLFIALMAGPQASFIAEAFPVRQRYTGASLSYSIGAMLGGGVGPIAATALYSATGSTSAVSVYLTATGLISAVGALLLRAKPDVVPDRPAATPDEVEVA